MRKRQNLTERFPHVVILPPNSKSPTNSIYRNFDIVQQTKAVSTFSDKVRTVRCSEPFILSVMIGNKVKELKSRTK